MKRLPPKEKPPHQARGAERRPGAEHDVVDPELRSQHQQVAHGDHPKAPARSTPVQERDGDSRPELPAAQAE